MTNDGKFFFGNNQEEKLNQQQEELCHALFHSVFSTHEGRRVLQVLFETFKNSAKNSADPARQGGRQDVVQFILKYSGHMNDKNS